MSQFMHYLFGQIKQEGFRKNHNFRTILSFILFINSIISFNQLTKLHSSRYFWVFIKLIIFVILLFDLDQSRNAKERFQLVAY